MNPFGVQFSPEEEEEFSEMARSDGFYERFARSVAPSIYGSLGMLSFTIYISILIKIHRYQESHHLFVIRWFKESFTRWYETTR